MRPIRLFLSILTALLAIAVAGCDSQSATPVMPDVVGKQLDVALSDIKRAGIDSEPEILGGGVFGILDKSNWQVCEQLPSAGENTDDTPRLTVDRECGTGSETTMQSGSEDGDDASTSESATPEAASEPSGSASPTVEAPLTTENNPDFATIVGLTDYCSPKIEAFAEKYAGKVLQFDGNIGAMANHGNYKTRYDILVGYGDFNEDAAPGPAFQLRDVNTVSDLHFAGDSIRDTIGVGDNIRLTATVDKYEENSCLFLLDPVSTDFR